MTSLLPSMCLLDICFVRAWWCSWYVEMLLRTPNFPHSCGWTRRTLISSFRDRRASDLGSTTHHHLYTTFTTTAHTHTSHAPHTTPHTHANACRQQPHSPTPTPYSARARSYHDFTHTHTRFGWWRFRLYMHHARFPLGSLRTTNNPLRSLLLTGGPRFAPGCVDGSACMRIFPVPRSYYAIPDMTFRTCRLLVGRSGSQ